MFALALVALVFTASARADDWAPNLTLSGTWHSNATHADVESDQIDTLQFKADILASQQYRMNRADTLHLTGHAAADWWPRYDGLLSGAIGTRAEWRHTFGVGAFAPVFSAELGFDGIAAREHGRSGSSTALTFSVRKRFNALTRVTLTHEIARQDARFAAFDREGNESSIELDLDFKEHTRLSFTARHRNGDVISYATPPRPDLEALAPQRVEVGTFGRPMVAYAVDARTWSARAALTRALDESSAIVLAYEWRYTEKKTLRFTNHLVSIALVHQF